MNGDQRYSDGTSTISVYQTQLLGTCKNLTNRRLVTSSGDKTNQSDCKHHEPKHESNKNPSPVRQTAPMPTVDAWETYKNTYDIKPKEYDERNDIYVTDLKSIKENILKQEIMKSRIRKHTDECEKTQNSVRLSVRGTELQKQDQSLPENPIAGISVIQNGDKPPAFNSCSKETVIYNDTARHKTGDKVNKLQVPDVNALTYNIERFPRNAMIIFNHEHFEYETTRVGTDRDVTALIDTFQRFRFEVTTHNDLKRQPLFKELQTFAKQNFEDCGCICVAILTHGSDHGYLKAKDWRYSERELFACFDTQKNPSLVAKPIIFLIQACRGDQLASSTLVVGQSDTPSCSIELDADSKNQSWYFLPTEADMIIFHSCFFGRASVRVVGEGTWFIQTICEQLNEYARTEHLEDIFRTVRKVVALEKGFENKKQMPVTSSTLLRKLYLVPQSNFGAEYSVNCTNNVIENVRFDANHNTTWKIMYLITEHAYIGIAFTSVYCCLLYSSIVREHVYLFISLLFVYMIRFGVSWKKMLATSVLLFIFFIITDVNITSEIVKAVNFIISQCGTPTPTHKKRDDLLEFMVMYFW